MEKITSIREKLKKTVIKITLIASIAGVLSVAAMKIIDVRYGNLVEEHGFAQGDVGRLLAAFIRTDGNVRNAVSYMNEDARASARESVENYYEKIDNYFAVVEGSITGSEEKEKVSAAKEAWQNYKELSRVIMDEAGNDSAAIQAAQERAVAELDPNCIIIDDSLTQLWDVLEKDGRAESDSTTIFVYIIMLIIAVIIGVAMFVSIRLGDNIAKGIAVPMKACADRLVKLAQGDLASEVPVINTKDEVGELAQATEEIVDGLKKIIEDQREMLGKMAQGNFNVDSKIEDCYMGDFQPLLVSSREITVSLSDTLHQIQEVSEQVSMASAQLADGAQALAEGATDQASSVEELVATIDEVSEQVTNNARNAADASRDAGSVGRETRNGNDRMNNMTQAMNEIDTVTKQIVEIIDTIESIAAQTNLLSLNASIEAARAGEAGKGFAVVADEIRDLAEQSASAANNTRELIEKALHEVENGNEMAGQTAEAFRKVTEGIQKIVEVMEGVRDASERQADAIEQLDQGVGQINGVVQSNSATAQESSATSEELSAQAETLNMLMNKFILKKD